MEGFTLYRAHLTGLSPVIHHCGLAGLATDSPIKREIKTLTSVTDSKRTEKQRADLRMLESLNSLWLDGKTPTVPAAAVRACIELAARKTKEGPDVREGLVVLGTEFDWDRDRYGSGGDDESLRELAKKAEFTVPVTVQRARLLRTRAMFETPWSVTVKIEGDDELISVEKLQRWLTVAGKRCGIGDWRPNKSGSYGRFTADVEVI